MCQKLNLNMEDVINTIDCRLMELNEQKEKRIMLDEDVQPLQSRIRELVVERNMFIASPDLIEKIKSAQLKHIRFISLSL